MSDKPTSGEIHNQTPWFDFRLKGKQDDQWAEWFEGLIITRAEGGDTLLTCPVMDQAALHGLLKKCVILVCRQSRSNLCNPNLHLLSLLARRDGKTLLNEIHPYHSKQGDQT